MIGSAIIRHYFHYTIFAITLHTDWDYTCRIMPHSGGIIFLYHYAWSYKIRPCTPIFQHQLVQAKGYSQRINNNRFEVDAWFNVYRPYPNNFHIIN
ncbi:hypothetical protein HanIR_Chr04g0201651 [Helianthus annuus]|nr:hypothetical protein HanIR_Chr04g0201651 [Helianthus annuus]